MARDQRQKKHRRVPSDTLQNPSTPSRVRRCLFGRSPNKREEQFIISNFATLGIVPLLNAETRPRRTWFATYWASANRFLQVFILLIRLIYSIIYELLYETVIYTFFFCRNRSLFLFRLYRRVACANSPPLATLWCLREVETIQKFRYLFPCWFRVDKYRAHPRVVRNCERAVDLQWGDTTAWYQIINGKLFEWAPMSNIEVSIVICWWQLWTQEKNLKNWGTFARLCRAEFRR